MDKRTATVAIIGGGVIGTSIAYHLAARGVADVVVVEKGSLGGGSTAEAPGGVRQQFAREIEVRLAVESMKVFETFEKHTGVFPALRKTGYLFLLTTDPEVQDFTERVALQQRLGVPSRLLSRSETLEIVPGLALDGVLAAAYCPTDGRVSPASIVYGYARLARGLGVQFIENTEVLNINVSGGMVDGLHTSDGRIDAPVVINAAGIDAREVAAWVGVDLPVFPKPMHVVITGPVSGLPSTLPCIMEPSAMSFIAPEGEGVLMTVDRDEPFGTDRSVDWDFVAEVAAVGATRIPSIFDAGLQRAYVGVYTLTPDQLPIVGPVPRMEGFFCAAGLSGHGVMFSPAIGEGVAAMVQGDSSPSVSLSELGIERFGEAIDTGRMIEF